MLEIKVVVMFERIAGSRLAGSLYLNVFVETDDGDVQVPLRDICTHPCPTSNQIHPTATTYRNKSDCLSSYSHTGNLLQGGRPLERLRRPRDKGCLDLQIIYLYLGDLISRSICICNLSQQLAFRLRLVIIHQSLVQHGILYFLLIRSLGVCHCIRDERRVK